MATQSNTLALAARNLLRNRRRSLTTLLAMVIGAIAILVFGGYSRDINYGLQTGFVRNAGHLQIQRKDYFLFGSGNPAAYGIADYPRIVELVSNDPVLKPMLTVVTPIMSLGGLAGNFEAGVSRTVLARGVQVAEQNQMRRWNDYKFPGQFKTLALTDSSDDSVVIGTGVARVLQLCGPLKVRHCPVAEAPPLKADAMPLADAPADIADLAALERKATAKADQQSGGADAATGNSATGSDNTAARIEMLAANARGAPNVASLRVVKAEPQGVKELDDIFLLMHLSQAQRLIYGAAEPQVTAVVLQLQHTSQIPAARARLQEILPTGTKGPLLEVQDFATLNPSYGQITGLFAAIFGFISMLIGAIVLFTVSNTMSMAVVERTVEIGTLRAIGVRRAGIRKLFMTEGFLLGLVGAGLGVLLALGIAYVINHSGLTWLPPGQLDPAPLTVRVWGETRMIVGTAIGLTLVAVISAWWPARRAAALNIVDALRHA